ncbi:hypothetical protein BX659_10488 [Orenia metallireducens]|uniref:Pili assembly chaperone N-terminal domain-containing protein n=1 Tax=Orenia metallireducens TaxID=1413210 RepID=A0A285GCN0_9FIRM|nr:hypothetical protein [Orenia metallireducens]PRX32539.1 hypothetical protein BX659_10488 [Orenia metallireducens]SNY20924.1 hypothetical protein SAMN06265827_10660 [Orenia metallireducens]
MKKYSKLKISLLIFLSVFIFFTYSERVMAITHIEPARIILYVEPGDRTTGTIKVTNKSEKETEVKAILYDWTLDDNDGLNATIAGSRPETLDGLIKFNPRRFKLKPGKTQVVRFTISAPKDINIERRGIVFFEEETGLIEKTTGANVVTQIGTTIYLAPTTAKSEFKLLGAKVYIPKDRQKKKLGVLSLNNQGNAHIRYIISYKIIDEKGALVNENKFTEQVILPGFKRGVTFPIKQDLKSGSYKMLLSFEFHGTAKKANYTIPFKIN